jgi:glycerol-3-phosphate dehydrogenase (NAD(P)+)
MSIHSIGIIGGGAWGTALAQICRKAGRDVLLWAREESVTEAINHHHQNSTYLPGIALDKDIRATSSISNMGAAETLLLVAPAQHVRELCKVLGPLVKPKAPLIICTKGIEIQTGDRMSEIVAASLPDHPIAVLSGPTFAGEVAQGKPTAVTIACKNVDLANELAQRLSSRYFRPYASNDVTGVELGAAIKNVLAIGCGIVMGRGLGENARAAVITRGLNEMSRLIVACGGKMETAMGLSCLGDLVLTCGSLQSRNMSLGHALGKGEALEKILGARHSVTEGVSTSAAAVILAKKYNVEMPLVEAVHSVLHEGADIDATITQLLSRPLRAEEI